MARSFALTIALMFLLTAGALASSLEVELLGRWSSAPCDAFEVAASFAYLGGGNSFEIVDMTVPSAPDPLGHMEVTGPIKDVTLSGQHAFLACMDNGLRILDVSVPGDPHEVGAYVDTWRAWSVAVDGVYAYVASSNAGIRVIDISDPTTPVEVGFVLFGGYVLGVVHHDGYLYVSARLAGVHIVDVRIPTAPVHIATFDPPGANLYGRDVFVTGDLAYMCGSSTGILIADISDPASPTLVATVPTPNAVQPDRAVVVGTTLTMITNDYTDSGLWVLDIANPSYPHVEGYFALPRCSRDLAIEGERVYVANGDRGLRVIDSNDPADMTEISAYETGGQVRDVALEGSIAALACGWAGLRVVDINDPTAPVLRGTIETGGEVTGVDLDGSLAAVADNELRLVDIADPDDPVLLGEDTSMCIALDVILRDQVAFVQDSYCGVQIIDVSDPVNPAFMSRFDVPGDARAVDISLQQDRLYMISSYNGPPPLIILDVSDLWHPEQVGFYLTGSAITTEPIGTTLVVADLDDLRFVDVSDPEDIFSLGAMDHTSYDLVWHDFGLLSATKNGGLDVIWGGWSGDPYVETGHPCGGNAAALAVQDNTVALVDSYDGLWLLQLVWTTDVPDAAGLSLAVSPNPFNPRTTVSYTLPCDDHVQLDIVDLRGRLVRRLVDGVRPAGPHRIAWSGTDASGRPVPSGTYLAVLRTADTTTTARLSLVK